MSDLGTQFVNIQSDDISGATATERLRNAVLLITRQLPPADRGVIWFPPGTYEIQTSFRVDERVTLAFSPGAVIVPIVEGSNRLLIIDGAIDADAGRIFGTSSPGRSSSEIGSVVLTNTQMPRVYPEWWGAVSESDDTPVFGSFAVTSQARANAKALQAAVDAVGGLRGGLASKPLTVYLGGTYRIDRKIVVRSPELEVILEGAPGSPQAPSIVWSDARAATSVVSRDSLIEFYDTPNATLRGVYLDAGGITVRCLYFRRTEATRRIACRLVLERSGFRNAISTLVDILDDAHHRSDLGEVSDSAPFDVLVRQCSYDGIVGDVQSSFAAILQSQNAALRQLAGRNVSLLFRAPINALLEVRGCSFQGSAMRSIRVVGGRIEVSDSRFMTNGIRPGTGEAVFPTATDIELIAPEQASASRCTLTAVACDSTSPSFLRVVPAASSAGLARENLIVPSSVVLRGVRHVWESAGANSSPPALIFEDVGTLDSSVQFGSPRRGTTLWLTACRFDTVPATTRRDIPGQRVFVSPYVSHIYWLGTFFIRDDSSAFLSFFDASPTLVSVAPPPRQLDERMRHFVASSGFWQEHVRGRFFLLPTDGSGARIFPWATWL